MPFSTLGMNCVGTDPPTTWDTNSNPDPRGSGSNSTWHTAYWPCPPDCLTWRPVTRAELRIVARSGTLTGSVSTSAPLARRRDSTTSACASPMHHSTVWCVSGLRSSRSVGSAATSRVSVRPSASSSARLRATTATGSSGSGRFQHDSSSGSDAAETVSPVSALPSLVSAAMSPATHASTSRSWAPSGDVDVREPLVDVVAAVVGGRRRPLWSAAGRAR